MIELSGEIAQTIRSYDGFQITRGDSVVRGLTITQWRDGILLVGWDDNLIEGNSITNNTRHGVNVLLGIGNRIQSNSIHSNGGLGIDIGGDGITNNDDDDSDTGPNNFQNTPMLSFSLTVPDGDYHRVSGSFKGTPNTRITIELFGNEECTSSGQNQGRTHLGSYDTTTDSSGEADLYFSIPGISPKFVTSVAIASNGDTSEFSPCISGTLTLTGPSQPVPEGSPITFDLSLDRSLPVDWRMIWSAGICPYHHVDTTTPTDDYTPASGSITISAREITAQIAIDTIDDNISEAPETFTITLSDLTLDYITMDNPTATATILSDDNATPVFPPTAGRSIAENTTPGKPVGAPVTATDAEGNPLTYSLLGDDASHFTINPTTGQILTKSVMDFENPTDADGDSQYHVTVQADDGFDNGITAITVPIRVLNVGPARPNAHM